MTELRIVAACSSSSLMRNASAGGINNAPPGCANMATEVNSSPAEEPGGQGLIDIQPAIRKIWSELASMRQRARSFALIQAGFQTQAECGGARNHGELNDVPEELAYVPPGYVLMMFS